MRAAEILSAARNLLFLSSRDNLVDAQFILSMVGHCASVSLQQVVRAALPTMARYFGLPVALHFVATVSVLVTVTIWFPAARGKSKAALGATEATVTAGVSDELLITLI